MWTESRLRAAFLFPHYDRPSAIYSNFWKIDGGDFFYILEDTKTNTRKQTSNSKQLNITQPHSKKRPKDKHQ
jgi:hypothetical protein